MNTTELMQCRAGFLGQASNDMSSRLNDFMRTNHLNLQQLARALALPPSRVENMLNGHVANVTLEEFASVLIATGTILEIKPIEQSRMPQRGGMPIPRSHGGMPMPPMPERDERGRFRPRVQREQVASEPVAKATSEFDSMNREQLVDEVLNNGWEQEIDLYRATRPQIIAFLESKVVATPSEETVAEGEMSGTASTNPSSALGFLAMLGAELDKNPDLKAQFKNLFQ